MEQNCSTWEQPKLKFDFKCYLQTQQSLIKLSKKKEEILKLRK